MPFDVEGALKEGYSYSDIASHLSNQSKFNLDGARNEGYSDEDIVNHLIGEQPKQQPIQPEETKPIQDIPTDEALKDAVPFPTTQEKIKKAIFGDYTPVESIKRQAGLTARSAVEGALALPDIAAAGVRGAANLLLPEQYEIPPRFIGQDITSALNLPEPETPTEKIVGRATEFMTGAGSGNVLKYLKPQTRTGKAIQESFIEEMPTQIVSGGAAGAAAGAIEESGGGVLSQTAGSAGAGILPFLLSKGKTKPQVVRRYTDPKSLKKSDELLNKYKIEAADAINRGVPIEEVRPFVNNKLGIRDSQIRQAAINKDEAIPIPQSKLEADNIAVANRMAQIKKQSSSNVQKFYTMAKDFIQPIDTRLNKYFPQLFNRVRRNSIDEHIFAEQYISTVKPFMSAIKSLPDDAYRKMTLDLYNGNFNTARKIMVDYLGENQAKQFDVATNLLKKLYKDLDDAGFEMGEIKNYFPRGSVKDLDGLYAHLESKYGYKAKDAIEKALEDRADKLNVTIETLPEEEAAKILNNYIRGYGQKSQRGKPSFSKQRQIQELTEDELPFFNDPVDSLNNYIRSVVSSVQEAKFFGRNNLKAEGRVIDTDASVGNLLSKEFAKIKGPKKEYLDEASSLLRARFNAGKQSPNKIMQMARDLTYMATLGNPLAAATQLGDTFISVVAHGFKNTMADAFNVDRLTIQKLGLEDLAAEFTNNPLVTAKYLDKILSSKLVQFRNVDRFGKNRNINGAINKAKNLLSTQKGERQLKSKYGGFFGDKFDQFAADLKRDVFSPDVKAYAFMELADVQPIFLESLPRIYLQHPQARLFYALQSFTLKQLDYMNRNIRQVWKAGNRKEAAKQALVYYSLIVGANTGIDMAKDIALGRPVKPEEVPTDAFFNMLKLFGLSRYTAERSIKQGDVAGAVQDIALSPATLSLFTPIRDITRAIQNNDIDKINSYRYVPVLGPWLYEWFGGGREAYMRKNK